MKRNGEYKTYRKFQVPNVVESEWKMKISTEIFNGLIQFNNADLFSKSMFYLCYFDISTETQSEMISKALINDKNISISNLCSFIESQKSLYTNEFLNILRKFIHLNKEV